MEGAGGDGGVDEDQQAVLAHGGRSWCAGRGLAYLVGCAFASRSGKSARALQQARGPQRSAGRRQPSAACATANVTGKSFPCRQLFLPD